MELEQYENYEDSFVSPEVYNNKLETLSSGLETLLSEFKKIYVIAKMNQGNQEYQNQFDNIKSSLDNLISKTYSISNDVEEETNNLNKQLININALIREEKEKNRVMKMKLGIVEDQNNASIEMINDYKTIYDKNYLRNWGLILSGLICFAAISTVYKKPVIIAKPV